MTSNIFDTLPRDCWLTIDQTQLAENIHRLQTIAGCPVLASVKANGYGHGYTNAARAFLAGGACYLGVANLAEALFLRHCGIPAKVLIMGGMLKDEMAEAARAGFEFFVWNNDHISVLREITGLPVHVHIKVDTGAGRIGCLPQDAPGIAEALQSIAGVEITGLATHFASADDAQKPDTERQIAAFDRVIASLASLDIRPRIIHAANSAGALYFPQARYDMIRAGITAYGVPPNFGSPLPEGIKPALTWHARIIATKILPAGHGVGYCSDYKMPTKGRIGILPVGYADGFRRKLNANAVLVEGRECKVLGRVSMDQCAIDLDGLPDITGAEAILIGRQGDVEITANDIARRWDMISYEVLTGLSARIPRRTVGQI